MIVVGLLAPHSPSSVTEIAHRAAAAGAKVEMVGLVPGDAAWDKVLFDLTAAGVGHATVVRSARGSMEPADLDLALRYLPDIRCVVLVGPPARLLPTAISGADFAGAPLVVVGPLDRGGDGGARCGERRFARDRSGPTAQRPRRHVRGFVAALATRLDAGDPPDTALRATVAALAVDPA